MNTKIIEYRGFKIEIEYDQDAENPWEDQDGLPPLILYSNDYQVQGNIDLRPPALTRRQIVEHAKAIASELGCRNLVHAVNWYGTGRNCTGVEAINGAITKYLDDCSGSDRLSALAKVYEWVGIVAVDSSVSGYCQGDYYDVLAVATPEFLYVTGLTPDDDLQGVLERDVELFGHWAFGDCYGYRVTDDSGVEIESCWGYYGPDHEYSGLMDDARQAIDEHIAYEREQRQDKLKQMVRARAPLEARVKA